MLTAFQIVLLVVIALSSVAALADERRFHDYLLVLISSGSLFLIGVLISGIINKI